MWQKWQLRERFKGIILLEQLYVMAPYALIQYPQFQLTAIYHGPKSYWKSKK
jgi:hypothetical protein